MFKRVLFVVLSVALIAAYESAIGQPQKIKTPTTAEALAADQKLQEQTLAEEEAVCLISRFDNIMQEVGAEQGYNLERSISNYIEHPHPTALLAHRALPRTRSSTRGKH